MTTSLPTYIPIKDAAAKYGYGLRDLKRMAQSGKIKAVQLPDGDMVVSEKSVMSNLAKIELPEFKQHRALAGNPYRAKTSTDRKQDKKVANRPSLRPRMVFENGELGGGI